MPCGAIVYFDPQTDAAIRRLWQALEDAGRPSMNYPPHLTLAACEDMDFEGMRGQIASFAAAHPPMTVSFNGLGIFNSSILVIYLALTTTHALLGFHTRFEEMARPYLDKPNAYYLPGAWVPHVTLDREFPLETTGALTSTLLGQDLPKTGLLRELVLVDFTPGQAPMREMFTARLGQDL